MNASATGTVSQAQARSGAPWPEDIIICRDVHKWYGGYHAVRGVTTTIRQGETVVITGPSGSGKSTFLRILNQLEEHQRGDIIVDGVLLNRETRNIGAVRRNIGMVSQDFTLFPHMSILDNITLAPRRVLKEAPREARERAMEILSRVGILEQAGKAPQPAVLRSAAAGRHRPGPCHEAQDHAPGRADLRDWTSKWGRL